MRVVHVRLPYRCGDTWRFVLAGDIHWGNAHCDTALVRQFVRKYAGDPYTRVILMGDEADAIATADGRFDARALAEKYRGERNFIDLIVGDLADELAPLRGQIVAGVDSNHTRAYRKLSDSDLHYRLSEALQFQRLGYGGWVYVHWDWHSARESRANRSRSTVFHVTHGRPSRASTPGGAINTLAADAQWFISDVIAHGHTHRLSAGLSRIMFEPSPRRDSYTKRKQHLVQTGSFLKGYSPDEFSPYSEVRRYPPVDLGWVEVTVSFDRNAEPRLSCAVREY